MWQANWLFSGIKGDGMKKTVKTVKKVIKKLQKTP